MIRIAVPIVSSLVWQGGFNYLFNICRVLGEHMHKHIKVVICFGSDISRNDKLQFESIPNIEFLEDDAFSFRKDYLKILFVFFAGVDKQAMEAFKVNNIDLVFESANFFGRKCGFPILGWIPDFQHKHFPENFTFLARLKREVGFRSQMRYSRTLLLSSNTSLKDLHSFYPRFKGKVLVNKFPAIFSESELRVNNSLLRLIYDLPKRFIFLPNQFWLHKNHLVVVEALKILQQRKKKVCVISTGSFFNPKQPQHVDEIKDRIYRYQLNKQFIILGRVPRSHIVSLMRTCAFFINPSKNEGWSTSVEEAKVFSTPMVLSDIPIHREQAGNNARFFPADDPEFLANLIQEEMEKKFYSGSMRFPKYNLENEAKKYAAKLHLLIKETLDGVKR